MSLDYNTYVNQLANLMVVGSTDANFITFLPGCIDYAEQRIYRELDLLYTQVTDATGQVSSGNRIFTLPTGTGTYIIVDVFNIITPANTGSSVGTRVALIPVDRQFIDVTYPSGQTATGTPQYFAMNSNTEVILGPSPDAAYFAEIVGIQRPAPLTNTNSSTILTQYVPDLFMAASMVFAAGYMRDFGSQADNPQMGASWEAQYKTLIGSAIVEQMRAKFLSEGWTSNSPAPLTKTSR